MRSLFRFLYSTLLVYPMYFGFIIGAFFKSKIRRSLLERVSLWKRLSSIPNKTGKKRIWIHVSSAGELEQAKPLLRLFQERDGDKLEFVFTFFSPSAYKPMSKVEGVLFYDYLPIDTYRNSKRMFDLIEPDLVIFVKFDIWPNIVWEAQKRAIPKILIDGTLHRRSKRYSNFLGQAFYNSIYRCFDFIGTVSENDLKRFFITAPSNINVKVVGDTRFDQVAYRYKQAEIGNNSKRIPRCLIAKETEGLTLLCGSTWEEDDRSIVLPILRLLSEVTDLNLVIVPHEPTKKRVRKYMNLFGEFNPVKFSDLKHDSYCSRVVVVDNVGLLAELYKVSDLAYVGGAFSTGVHNVMEPAIRGVPAVFGPHYYNSPEAEAMIRLNCAFSCSHEEEFYSVFSKLIKNKAYTKELGEVAKKFINESLGSDERYYREISKFL